MSDIKNLEKVLDNSIKHNVNTEIYQQFAGILQKLDSNNTDLGGNNKSKIEINSLITKISNIMGYIISLLYINDVIPNKENN